MAYQDITIKPLDPIRHTRSWHLVIAHMYVDERSAHTLLLFFKQELQQLVTPISILLCMYVLSSSSGFFFKKKEEEEEEERNCFLCVKRN